MKIIVHAAAEYCIQGDAPPPRFFLPLFCPCCYKSKTGHFNWFLLVNSRLSDHCKWRLRNEIHGSKIALCVAVYRNYW